MGNLICSPHCMLITELQPSRSEASISQEKEVLTKTYKVFFKIYLLILFLAITIVRIGFGKDTKGKDFLSS